MLKLYLTQTQATQMFNSLAQAKEVAKRSQEWYYIVNEDNDCIEFTQDDEIFEHLMT